MNCLVNKKNEDENMKLQRRIQKQVIVLAAITVCASATAALGVAQVDEDSFSVEPELSIDSGDYGGGDTITTYAFSITGEYEITPAWTLSLTIVPWLQQNETFTDVVLVAGRPVHHFDANGRNPHHENTHFVHANHGDRRYFRPDSVNAGSTRNRFPEEEQRVDGNSEKNGEYLINSTRSGEELSREANTFAGGNNTEPGETGTFIEQELKHSGSESGIGDTSIDLSYRLMKECDAIPGIFLHGGLKIPTADEDKGLGTGKVDYLLGVDVSRAVGGWFLEAGVAYNILGRPEAYELENYLSGYGEITTDVLSNLEAALRLYGAQAASAVSDGELALGLELRYHIGHAGAFSAGLQKGLADGSPDFSAVFGYSISF